MKLFLFPGKLLSAASTRIFIFRDIEVGEVIFNEEPIVCCLNQVILKVLTNISVVAVFQNVTWEPSGLSEEINFHKRPKFQ